MFDRKSYEGAVTALIVGGKINHDADTALNALEEYEYAGARHASKTCGVSEAWVYRLVSLVNEHIQGNRHLQPQADDDPPSIPDVYLGSVPAAPPTDFHDAFDATRIDPGDISCILDEALSVPDVYVGSAPAEAESSFDDTSIDPGTLFPVVDEILCVPGPFQPDEDDLGKVPSASYLPTPPPPPLPYADDDDDDDDYTTNKESLSDMFTRTIAQARKWGAGTESRRVAVSVSLLGVGALVASYVISAHVSIRAEVGTRKR